MRSYEFHPLAAIWPLIEGDSFERLVEDIRKNGQEEPIVLFEEMILDGRNRYRACEIVAKERAEEEPDYEPDYEVYEGNFPVEFAMSLNQRRRHLSASQRSMCVGRRADLLKHGGDRRSEQFQEPKKALEKTTLAEAAADFSVSVSHVKLAKIVQDYMAAKRKKASSEKRALVGWAVDQDRIPVACAADLTKLDVSNATLTDLFSPPLPGEAIVKWVAAETKARKRKATFERIMEETGGGVDGMVVQGWPTGKFSVFYVDPPWRDEFGPNSRSIENHYPTMSTEEIKNLDVESICTDDGLLYLWALPHMREQAHEVMAAWGFEYRTDMVWVKDKIGLGQWVRNQHESLLIGRRGAFPTPEESSRCSSVVHAPVGKHSEKPEIFAEMIEGWYPDAVKIELFRRGGARRGWSAWGFEAKVAAE